MTMLQKNWYHFHNWRFKWVNFEITSGPILWNLASCGEINEYLYPFTMYLSNLPLFCVLHLILNTICNFSYNIASMLTRLEKLNSILRSNSCYKSLAYLDLDSTFEQTSHMSRLNLHRPKLLTNLFV
jgi:hypothetical protein